jgi:pantoate--beta-alanine ligase
MKIFKQIAPLKAFLKEARLNGKSIGLVPTMGALHKGHIALIKAAQEQNQIVVCSIFVNPTQFNNPADLLNYPRTIEKDTQLLKEVRCNVLFSPETEEIYPEKATLMLDFGTLDKVMEGKFRPGHFSGVGLVVSKLFHIVEPDHAYFGQKDWQQFAVIRQLVEDLSFNLRLHSVDTLREADGLALSSRNLRLSPEQRIAATVFYKAMRAAREFLLEGTDLTTVKTKVKEIIAQEPGMRLEYFELADSKNLNLIENVEGSNQPIMCIAGYAGEVRLIDNLFLYQEKVH